MKKAISLVLYIALFAMVFAEKPAQQQAVSRFLTASDIDAFIRNHKAIKSELAALGISEKDFGFDSTIAPDFDTLNFLNSIKTPPAADAVFAKYGMGKDGVRKIYVMNWATEVAILEREVQAEASAPEGMDVSMLGPIFADMKKGINPEDLKLVSARCDELYAVFSEEQAPVSEPSPEISSGDDENDADAGNYDDESAEMDDETEDEDIGGDE